MHGKCGSDTDDVLMRYAQIKYFKEKRVQDLETR